MALLLVAVTLARSAINLQRVPLGFDTESVYSAVISLNQARYRDAASRHQFYHDVLQRLTDDPNVAAAGAVLLHR